MVQITILDLNRVLAAVDDLSNIDKDRAIKSGLSAAGRVFVLSGRKNLLSRLEKTSKGRKKRRLPGNLLRSLTIRVKKSKLGVLAGFSGNGAHAHLVDLGTKTRQHPVTGTSGVMPANHFWSDAKASESQKAMSRIFVGVDRAVKRINARI